MKIVIAILAVFGIFCSLLLSFLAGGVVGVNVGYEEGRNDNPTPIEIEIEAWEDSIDMGQPEPVGALYSLEVLEMDAAARDVSTRFLVSSQEAGCVTITSGDYKCRVPGSREAVGNAFAVLYYRTTPDEHQALCEQALVYSLSKMGEDNAAVYLGLRQPDADYPQYPESEFLVYYTSKTRGLLAEQSQF